MRNYPSTTLRTNMLDLRPDTPVFRVFTLDRLLDAVVRRQLALVRPRMWEDPYENLLYQTPLKNPDGTPLSIELRGNRLYGQCWTLASVSDALWRIYSPYKSGIRVRTTAGELLKAIWKQDDQYASLKYFIGKVRYYTSVEFQKVFADPRTMLFDTSGRGPVHALLCKRKAFSHEREVRLIFQDSEDRDDQVIYFPIEPNSLFHTLLFDPRMDPATADTITRVLHKLGFRNRISQSSLYNTPKLRSHVV